MTDPHITNISLSLHILSDSGLYLLSDSGLHWPVLTLVGTYWVALVCTSDQRCVSEEGREISFAVLLLKCSAHLV